MGVIHTSLDADGKIRGTKWKADHILSSIVNPSRTFFVKIAGLTIDPGDTNWHILTETITNIAFDYIKPYYARIFSYGDADFQTTDNYIRLSYSGGDIASVNMRGSSLAQLWVGAWTACSLEADTEVWVRYRSLQATQVWKIWNVGVEFR